MIYVYFLNFIKIKNDKYVHNNDIIYFKIQFHNLFSLLAIKIIYKIF